MAGSFFVPSGLCWRGMWGGCEGASSQVLGEGSVLVSSGAAYMRIG